MDPTKPEDCDALDLRPVLRRIYPSYGPDWDAAIDFGIDVGQIEHNLSLTPTERSRACACSARGFRRALVLAG